MATSYTMLPVEEVLPELKAALAAHVGVVLVAPPGAGKTTRAPLALRDAPWLDGGRILVLSPRRIAARAAAARMAHLIGEPVGKTVGYSVRLDSKVSTATHIEVLTEGVFTRRILKDPMLHGVGAVLFDEFHERSLEGDLGLALARDAQAGLRPDLRLLVMSATLDAARIAAQLDDAPIIESTGRLFPIVYRYLGLDARAPLDAAMADAVAKAIAQETGSILCFLPGARDIERAALRLSEQVRDPTISIHALYGALEARDQDDAIAPPAPGKRKIVLATSIAETSLTIEGVRVVIDSGFARQARFEPALGLSRLETVRASQAAITQRAGRAGRTEPGVCWRLWDEPQTRAFPAFDPPEILAADLTSLCLDLAAWGVVDPGALTWLDAPPQAAWAEAQSLLKRLGALDGDGRLTDHGRAIAGFGLPPRLAHMVVAAQAYGLARTAAWLSVLLTEQGLGGNDADLCHRLAQMRTEGGPRATAARALADRLARGGGASLEMEMIAPDAAGRLLALAFPERVAMARAGKPGEALMANGRAVSLTPDHALAKAPFLVVADASGRADKARILAAAALPAQQFEAIFAAEIESADSCAFDANAQAIRARRVRRFGKITLAEGPGERIAPEARIEAWAAALGEYGVGLLGAEDGLVQLRARVAFLRGLEGEDWPDWSDASLAEGGDWLRSAAHNATRLSDFQTAVMTTLRDSLDWPLRQRLDAMAPARFDTPAGSSLAIDYAASAGPTLAVRLQELFGQDRHPSVANGKVGLILELLSPAQRPVQTTRDLPGFWRGSYADVKAQMKGRYPKHPWPDNPLAAAPTRRAKPRGE
jgi:ATP-dependent helicase HrpB